MRIDLVSFLDPQTYGGGGEQIVRQLIETGHRRGHDIKISSVRPKRMQGHDKPDLTILNDVFNHAHSYLSLGAWRHFDESFLNSIVKRGPFIHLNNAYGDVCNLPYLPCSGHSQPACPHKDPLSPARRLLLKDWSGQCFATRPLVQTLHRESLLDVFLSPLHLDTTRRILDQDLPQSYVLAPLIDTQQFRNQNLERDIEYLFVGVIGEAKGLEALRRDYGHTDIHLIGKCAPDTVLDFGHALGHVPYDQIPHWMNRAKNFVFLPRWPEPQGRVVCEAALCGCHIIGNDHVGALSFDFDLADPAQYDGVPDRFWQHVESLL